MTENKADYDDIMRTAEIIIDSWADKFRSDVPPDLETVLFWLETTPPELVLRGIEYAYESRVPNTYLLANLVKAVDDFIAGAESHPQVGSGSAQRNSGNSCILGGGS